MLARALRDQLMIGPAVCRAVRSAPLSIKNFDAYDRYLLWTALRAGRCYAMVKKGVHGYWIAEFPAVCPGGLPNPESGQMVRLDEIEGLAGSSRQPPVEPGPWLESLGLGLKSLAG
jgi:hypothetical protein